MSLPESVAPPSPTRMVGGALLLAAAYVVAGRLGLLLAIPPGYATAVWPPTGIALAGVLILGSRAGWGVWLGSFLVNLWVTWSGGHLTWSTAFMSATIALGAVAGALVALRSLRTDPSWSTSLERQRDIMRFLFLGSATMACVTATWGVGALLLFRVAPLSEAGVNWFTWWSGDLLGAMVFAPLALTAFGEPRGLWRGRRITVGLPLALAFLLAAIFFSLVRDWEGERRARARQAVVDGVERHLQASLEDGATIVESAVAFLASHPGATPADFQGFSRAMRPRARGMVALSWAPYRTPSEVPALEVWAASHGVRGFEVHGDGRERSGFRALAPLLFLEPDFGRGLIGLDLGGEPVRAQGLEAALREDRVVLTRAVQLGQGRKAFLLLRSARGPAGGPGPSPGVVMAEVDATAFLEQCMLTSKIAARGAQVALWDGPGPSALPLAMLGESEGLWQAIPAPTGGVARRVGLGGAQWRLEVVPPPPPDRDWVLWSVLTIGTLFTGLVGSLLLLVTGRARLVEDLAEERTVQLRERESQLLRQGRLLERTQAAAGVVGWDLDPATEAVQWTSDAGTLFGLAPGSMPTLRAALSLVRSDQLEPLRLALDRAARWGSAFEQDVEIHLPDGRIRWVRLTCAPRMEGDRVAGLYGSAQDITAMVEALRARDAFVSVVSHELRTPLTSIRGSLGLLASGVAGTLSEEARKLLALASSNCERQIHLVNDLLDMERINSGRLELREEAIALHSFLERALSEHEGYALSVQAHLVLHLPEEALQVRGDPDRLQQVLANLLSNACKFSPPGGTVILTACRRGQSARISVADEGTGVPEAFRDRIFQPFTQADTSDTRARGGTGLGLAISRTLAERMGGRMGFDSPAQGGSIFWVELPLA